MPCLNGLITVTGASLPFGDPITLTDAFDVDVPIDVLSAGLNTVTVTPLSPLFPGTYTIHIGALSFTGPLDCGPIPASPLKLSQLPIEIAYDYAILKPYVTGTGVSWNTPPPTPQST